ncbi:MAG: penicillin-binding transpeptidase domain-containing protein [Vicinamibacterales bacterium]
MADERNGRFRLPWIHPQQVARREAASPPFEWRATMRSRLLACAVIFALWTAAIEARLFYLQVISHSRMMNIANRQQLRTIDLPAKRGEIVDRNGRMLAYSVDGEAISADPTVVVHPEQTARAICAALDACNGATLAELLSKLLPSKKRFVYLDRQASAEAAQRVRALALPGIVLHKESRRYYPKRELAAHVLGYVGTDNEGLAGLEAAYEERISGQKGRMLLLADANRNAVAMREDRPATVGDSLELTIDQYLQHIAERELRAGVEEHNAAAGTVVIMQPQTGEILALANYPTFNPNAYRDAPDVDRKNRATQDIYEPGSTFKVVTASAGIEEGVLRSTDMIDCAPGYITFPGRRIRDVHPYGTLSFEDVIVKSSNVGAIKAGLRIGSERLGRYINRFGFGHTLSPDFRGESAGIVWNPAALGPSAVASISMGYQVSVTPLQMASAVSSVANGGNLMEPRVVRAFIHGGRREPVPAKQLRRTVSPETAAIMTEIMEAVVDRGTAKSARIEGFTIAGKTGTAAKLVNKRYSNSDYNTSFVGFLPSRKPALTILVVIDSPHGRVTAYGGTVAAPIFQRIAEAALRHLGIGPTINPAPAVIVASHDPVQPLGPGNPDDVRSVAATVRDGLMPDVRGLSARGAVKSLLRAGLSARIDGNGSVVEQSPEAGAELVPGAGVILKLSRRRAPVPAVPAGGAQQ